MSLADRAERLLGRPVTAARRLSGGDLSAVFHLMLADGDAIIAKQAMTAIAEAAMLRAIAATGAPVPTVLAAEGDLLLMQRIAHDGGAASAWPDLAHVLGLLHGDTGPRFGWSADHAFGPVAIENGWMDDWPGFWAARRLLCHLPHVDPAIARRIERLADRLGDLLPARPGAVLLHGDLWGGNVLASGDRVAALIDPACYYGDREVDVAMLGLFDRPPRDFIDALALAPGWRARQPAYRLWPLLVHLRLFGDSYAESVGNALAALGC
jgi:fructosamine-3-kinase